MGIGKNLARNWEILIANSKFYDALKLIEIQNKNNQRNKKKEKQKKQITFKDIASMIINQQISLKLNLILDRINEDINKKETAFNYFNHFKQSVSNLRYVKHVLSLLQSMDNYFMSLETNEMRINEGKWLIYECIENNYFDFIRLICDCKLWFLWVIIYVNNSGNKKHESLLELLHNQCVYNLCEDPSYILENKRTNMIQQMTIKQRVKMVNFMFENMHIFKSHWLNKLLADRTSMLLIANNSLFYKTFNQIIINDNCFFFQSIVVIQSKKKHKTNNCKCDFAN